MENESYTADNGATRYDEGKPQFHLLPIDGLRELGRVYTLGARKYEPYNWERGMAWSRCLDSLLRHLYAFWDGEQTDKESGLHHMAHVAWNAMAILVYSLRSIGFDDRKASLLSAQQNKEAASADPLTAHCRALKPQWEKSSLHGLIDRDLPPVKVKPLLCPLGFRIIDPAISACMDIGAGAIVMVNEAVAHYVIDVVKGTPTVWRVIPWDLRFDPCFLTKVQLVHRRGILAVLEREDKEPINNLRCIRCPDKDAFPGKSICEDCVLERAFK